MARQLALVRIIYSTNSAPRKSIDVAGNLFGGVSTLPQLFDIFQFLRFSFLSLSFATVIARAFTY